MRIDRFSNSAFVRQCRSEVSVITLTPGPSPIGRGRARRKATFAQTPVVLPKALQHIDFTDRHAAMQIGAHVVRLRRRRIVHIATDITVVVLGLDFAHRRTAGVSGNVVTRTVGVNDLVDVLGPQVVLRLAFAVLAVSVDEKTRDLSGFLNIHNGG